MHRHTEEHPSRNEDEYFAKLNAEQIKQLRAQLDVEREKAERESHRMRCPRCGARLEERKRGNVTLDICPECGGTWLDKGELAMIAGTEESGVRRYINSFFGVGG